MIIDWRVIIIILSVVIYLEIISEFILTFRKVGENLRLNPLFNNFHPLGTKLFVNGKTKVARKLMECLRKYTHRGD